MDNLSGAFHKQIDKFGYRELDEALAMDLRHELVDMMVDVNDALNSLIRIPLQHLEEGDGS